MALRPAQRLGAQDPAGVDGHGHHARRRRRVRHVRRHRHREGGGGRGVHRRRPGRGRRRGWRRPADDDVRRTGAPHRDRRPAAGAWHAGGPGRPDRGRGFRNRCGVRQRATRRPRRPADRGRAGAGGAFTRRVVRREAVGRAPADRARRGGPRPRHRAGPAVRRGRPGARGCVADRPVHVRGEGRRPRTGAGSADPDGGRHPGLARVPRLGPGRAVPGHSCRPAGRPGRGERRRGACRARRGPWPAARSGGRRGRYRVLCDHGFRTGRTPVRSGPSRTT